MILVTSSCSFFDNKDCYKVRVTHKLQDSTFFALNGVFLKLYSKDSLDFLVPLWEIECYANVNKENGQQHFCELIDSAISANETDKKIIEIKKFQLVGDSRKDEYDFFLQDYLYNGNYLIFDQLYQRFLDKIEICDHFCKRKYGYSYDYWIKIDGKIYFDHLDELKKKNIKIYR